MSTTSLEQEIFNTIAAHYRENAQPDSETIVKANEPIAAVVDVLASLIAVLPDAQCRDVVMDKVHNLLREIVHLRASSVDHPELSVMQ